MALTCAKALFAQWLEEWRGDVRINLNTYSLSNLMEVEMVRPVGPRAD